MAKRKPTKSLADPTKLKPIDKKDGTLQVIIETPKGSRNKFSFDPDQEIFSLKKRPPRRHGLSLRLRLPASHSR